MCQRNTGAPVVAWTTFPAASFAWIAGQPATYASSASAKRQFCSRCGSYMVFINAQSAGEVSINTASLDDPTRFPPQKHIFAESRIAWFNTDDELPTHRGSVGQKAE